MNLRGEDTSERRFGKYLAIVACLERDGHETRMARHVLETFEYIQSVSLAIRNELLAAAALKGMYLEATLPN